ncbi:MAG: BLUF domain-containing protein [Pseudomonadota bacterium]|nr:BLUF domain-containing protein [Pseudomonadota bacterium]
MLVRLLYSSRAAEPVRPELLVSILKKSNQNNPGAGITGVLCFSGDVFLQALEGGRAQVSALYNRIVADARHRDVVLLSYEDIDERAFAGWSMGQVNMARLNPALILKYSDRAQLDPFAVSGKVSLALLCELVATASVMSLP